MWNGIKLSGSKYCPQAMGQYQQLDKAKWLERPIYRRDAIELNEPLYIHYAEWPGFSGWVVSNADPRVSTQFLERLSVEEGAQDQKQRSRAEKLLQERAKHCLMKVKDPAATPLSILNLWRSRKGRSTKLDPEVVAKRTYQRFNNQPVFFRSHAKLDDYHHDEATSGRSGSVLHAIGEHWCISGHEALMLDTNASDLSLTNEENPLKHAALIWKAGVFSDPKKARWTTWLSNFSPSHQREAQTEEDLMHDQVILDLESLTDDKSLLVSAADTSPTDLLTRIVHESNGNWRRCINFYCREGKKSEVNEVNRANEIDGLMGNNGDEDSGQKEEAWALAMGRLDEEKISQEEKKRRAKEKKMAEREAWNDSSRRSKIGYARWGEGREGEFAVNDRVLVRTNGASSATHTYYRAIIIACPKQHIVNFGRTYEYKVRFDHGVEETVLAENLRSLEEEVFEETGISNGMVRLQRSIPRKEAALAERMRDLSDGSTISLSLAMRVRQRSRIETIRVKKEELGGG
jgi:hypothetical protein